ncbi:unnamed protein product, partial [Phaeothamnion confervicola]
DEGGGGERRRVRFSSEVEVSVAAVVMEGPQLGEDEEGEEEDLETRRLGDRVGVSSGDNVTVGAEDDDDDEEEQAAPRRMTSAISGEEEDTGQRFNEAGDAIEPFNLREEREVGHFDNEGTFVWRKEQEEPDAWIAGLEDGGGGSEEAIGAAAAAQSRRRRAERDAAAAAASRRAGGGADGDGGAEALEVLGTRELHIKLAVLLQPGETPLKALRRLGGGVTGGGGRGRGGGGRGRGGRSTRGGSSGSGAAGGAASASISNGDAATVGNGAAAASAGGRGGAAAAADAGERPPGDEEAFVRLTEITDALLQRGQVDIYQQTREELEQRLQENEASGAGGGSGGASGGGYFGGDTVFFEYRGEDGNVHGPFGASQVKAWLSAGYFQGPQAVMMRRVAPDGGVAGTAGAAAAAGAGASAAAPAAVAPSNGGRSGAEELMDDLEDDDDEGSGGSRAAAAGGAAAGKDAQFEWVSSESIDFSVL